jgi:hypothetical protein
MAKVSLKMKGIPGGKTVLRLGHTVTIPDEAVIKANMDAFSYAKVYAAEKIEPITIAAPSTPEASPPACGVAVKALLVLKASDGTFQRWGIPSPKLNVAGGIATTSTAGGKDMIPAEDGTNGLGGTNLAAKYCLLTGQTNVTFVSGSVIKAERSN